MTPLGAVRALLLRALVIVGLYAGFVVVLDRTGSDDALGAGLLFFLLVVVVGGAWGAWDAWRSGLPSAAVLWLLVGLAAGLGIPAASVAMDVTSDSVSAEIRDGALFLGLLVAVPALLGAVPGGVAHRARSRRS